MNNNSDILSTINIVKEKCLQNEEIKDVTDIIVQPNITRRRIRTLGIINFYFISSYGRLFKTSRSTKEPMIATFVDECGFCIRENKNPAKPTLSEIYPYNNHSSSNVDVYYKNEFGSYTNIRKLVYESFIGTFDRRTHVLFNIDGNPFNNHKDNISTIGIKEIDLIGCKDIEEHPNKCKPSRNRFLYYKITFNGCNVPKYFKGNDELAEYLGKFLDLKKSTLISYIHHHFDPYVASYLDDFLTKKRMTLEKITKEEYVKDYYSKLYN